MEYKSHHVNPGIPIPAKATDIHGITDADVAHEPAFKQCAKSVRDFLDGCDITGFRQSSTLGRKTDISSVSDSGHCN
jgi:DNA polymerase-3 subunit epsilon